MITGGQGFDDVQCQSHANQLDKPVRRPRKRLKILRIRRYQGIAVGSQQNECSINDVASIN